MNLYRIVGVTIILLLAFGCVSSQKDNLVAKANDSNETKEFVKADVKDNAVLENESVSENLVNNTEMDVKENEGIDLDNKTEELAENETQKPVNDTKNEINNGTKISELKITICKVIYDPPGKEPDDEMIRICNSGDTWINISEWALSDGEGTYIIPQNTVVQSNSSWEIFGRAYNPTGDAKRLYLANKDECLVLLTNKKEEVDRKCW